MQVREGLMDALRQGMGHWLRPSLYVYSLLNCTPEPVPAPPAAQDAPPGPNVHAAPHGRQRSGGNILQFRSPALLIKLHNFKCCASVSDEMILENSRHVQGRAKNSCMFEFSPPSFCLLT